MTNFDGTLGVFNHDDSVPIHLVGAAAVIGIGTAVFGRRLVTVARKARLTGFGPEERLVFLAISYGLFITIVPAGLVSALGTLVLFITSL